MPTAPIYFGNDQKSGDQELAGASPLAINVITDGAGAIRRRPAIAAWSDFPGVEEDSPIIGLYAWEDELYYVNENRHIYKINPDTGTTTDLSVGGGPSYLAGAARPIFAETSFRLVIAGGAEPEKIDSGETTAERLGGSPAPASHVVAIASRLVFNDLSDASTDDNIQYSTGVGSAGNELYDPLAFTRAEAKPDSIVGLFGNSNELYVFGRRSLQVYVPEVVEVVAGGVTLFTPQRAVSYGCAAGYSIIEGDEGFHWLDDKRRFMTSDGRGATEISAPISRTLDGIAVVTDCFGFRWIADQFDAMAWIFPSDGRTFVAQGDGGWSQWHGWTQGSGHTIFPIKSHHFWPERNVHLVGMADGSIATLDTDAQSDLGTVFKAEILTGFIDHDTTATKHCEAVRFFFQRGHGASTTTPPQVLLSWRDSLGDFTTPIRLSLGLAADYAFSVERRSLGTYRSRQWKLEFTDAVDFVLARCEETYAVGGNN